MWLTPANILSFAQIYLAPVMVPPGRSALIPVTSEPYYSSFPLITIRDMVKAHILLRKHLGIDQIFLLMGGSMGGYQAMEWAIMEKDIIRHLFLLATSPTESAWGIATHTAQRLAIEADGTWQLSSPEAGAKGLKAARAYRHAYLSQLRHYGKATNGSGI
jgi:homoserine O-acetyltransferase